MMRQPVTVSEPGAPTPFREPDPAAEQRLADRIGIAFNDPLILRLALTHRSVLHDWLTVPEIQARLQSNERLEFLGDAVLGAVVAEYLYDRDRSADEGTLTRQRVAIVRAETLVRWARELDLHACLYLGTGERVSEGIRDRMLAGAFEALVGAIHIDQGREAANAFVMRFLRRDIASLLANEQQLNPKGRLQEVLQERSRVAPDYVTIAEEGPDHARHFTVAVVLENQHIGVGSGTSKRAAQQEAARQALISLEDPETLRAEADMASAVPVAARVESPISADDAISEATSREG
jgi:ribonuclease-3